MADKTALAESAQALLCAVADLIGKTKSNQIFDVKLYPEYPDFRAKVGKNQINKSLERIVTPGVSGDMIETFLLDDNSWYISSVKIAKKLVNDIGNIDKDLKIGAAGFQKLFYFRGDDEVMGNIESLFKLANKSKYTSQAKFGNVNKWSPADIYLGSSKAKTTIRQNLNNAQNENYYDFPSLNSLVANLIDSGDLLPLSLKKVTKTEPVLQLVNFDRKDEISIINKVKIKSVTDWVKYKKVKFGQKAETRDMRLMLESGGEIKLRHDPSAKRFVAEAIFSKAEARGGSIGSIKVFCQLLKYIDSGLADSTLKKYQAGEVKYYKALEKIEYLRKDKKRFDFERGAISAIHIINEIMPDLKKFFKSNKKKDKFARLMYEYITSRTPLSGKFVIAK